MGGGRKGKGKGQAQVGAELPSQEQLERAFAAEVQEAIPAFARHRARTALVNEWNVPTCSYEHLGAQPAVAYVPKHAVATALRQVGTTRAAVAIVTSQPGWELHLRGYPTEEVYVHLEVTVGTAREEFYRPRWLTQLGCGSDMVRLSADGPTVDITAYMRKVTIKLRCDA
eukprot:1872574-Amphidinium_carterae.2